MLDAPAANARRQSAWGRRLIANLKWQIQDRIANSSQPTGRIQDLGFRIWHPSPKLTTLNIARNVTWVYNPLHGPTEFAQAVRGGRVPVAGSCGPISRGGFS